MPTSSESQLLRYLSRKNKKNRCACCACTNISNPFCPAKQNSLKRGQTAKNKAGNFRSDGRPTSNNGFAPVYLESPDPRFYSTSVDSMSASNSSPYHSVSKTKSESRQLRCVSPVIKPIIQYTQQRQQYELAQRERTAQRTTGTQESIRNYLESRSSHHRTTPSTDLLHQCLGIDCEKSSKTMTKFQELQQFRIKNANDCFNVHRQNDLRLRGRASESFTVSEPDSPSRSSGSRPEEYSTPKTSTVSYNNSSNKSSQSSSQKPLTPYAIRQRLLKIRLEAEQIGKPNVNKVRFYGAVDKSLALRFQETY